MTDKTQPMLSELARIKVIFQQRAILAAMGLDPERVKVAEENHGRR